MGRLTEYRARRDLASSSEPAGERDHDLPAARQLRFVIQEHHARRLHWDFRLEHGGVLVSWAVPRGIPDHPRRNHLAVHVEDHPLEYISFSGHIPAGNYGAGEVRIWDQGTYELHKWEFGPRRQEVKVTLHGSRVEGTYALFRTRAEDWIMHRMDPSPDSLLVPLPQSARPMLARSATELPEDLGRWAVEYKWDGIRALILSSGGSLKILDRRGEDMTQRYPELRPLARELGSTSALLDGEIVALDAQGTPSFELLQARIGLDSSARIRRAMSAIPVLFMAFDLLHLGGRDTRPLPYLERRRLLEELALQGPHWQTPEHARGEAGRALLQSSRELGLEGVVAKRIESTYEEGRRSGAWVKVKNRLRQEFVVGGYTEAQGARQGLIGALLVGYYRDGELIYAGRVGSGLGAAARAAIEPRLMALKSAESPFSGGGPPPRVHFARPQLVVEVGFSEWTRQGRLRAPIFLGSRPDREPASVVREVPEG